MLEGFFRKGQKEVVPGFRADVELDRLTVEYTELAQEYVRCRMDDRDGKLDATKRALDEFKTMHGSVLKAYLQPYIDKNLPGSYFEMPKEEYPRWYAAGTLENWSPADDEPMMPLENDS